MKRFRTTGVCNPNIQYMVDISDKVREAKKLVENNEYFIIYDKIHKEFTKNIQ
mgnify:CR=1 FL=1